MPREYEKDSSVPDETLDTELVPVESERQDDFKEVIGKMTYDNYFGE